MYDMYGHKSTDFYAQDVVRNNNYNNNNKLYTHHILIIYSFRREILAFLPQIDMVVKEITTTTI